MERQRKLQTPWTLWFEQKLEHWTQSHGSELFSDHLQRVGTFDTLEGFAKYYKFLKRLHELDNSCTFYLFRYDTRPLWESYPKGGSWILKISKEAGENLTMMWEQIVAACIGESFEEPTLVGMFFGLRRNENVLAVWNSDNASDKVRFRIGEKLKRILSLPPHTVLEYKDHKHAMSDGSSFRNTVGYEVQEEEHETRSSQTTQ